MSQHENIHPVANTSFEGKCSMAVSRVRVELGQSSLGRLDQPGRQVLVQGTRLQRGSLFGVEAHLQVLIGRCLVQDNLIGLSAGQ